jgi:hypothetical protein
MKPFLMGLLVVGLTFTSSAWSASQQRSVRCAPRWGEPGARLVGSAQTAKDVFVAIEREFYPKADRVQYPDAEAIDSGAYWDVYRTRNPDRDLRSKGTMLIRAGGGQLSMRIDKCTSAISHVFLTR